MKTEIYIDSDGQELTKEIWDNTVEYFNKKGLRHRLDGPAVIWHDSRLAWFKDGKRHREDGPSIISADGLESYHLEGKPVTKRDIDLLWLRKQIKQ